MIYRSISEFKPWLIPIVFFTSGGSVAYAANTQAVVEQRRGAVMKAELRYQRGLVDAIIVNAPLGKVLHELALTTGTQIRFIDPAIGVWPVSVSVRATTLPQGIEKVLSGFSYALDRNAQAPTLIICSTPPTIKGLNTAGAQIARALPQTERNRPLNTSGAASRASSNEVLRESIPQSLDEFDPIAVQEWPSDSPIGNGQSMDSSADSLRAQEYGKVLLRRALDALNSEHTHLYRDAFDQLVELQDSEATEALIEAASNTSRLDSIMRMHATAALGRHASMLRFTNTASVNALKQLAEDSDYNIRSVARQAVTDMEQYQDSAQ